MKINVVDSNIINEEDDRNIGMIEASTDSSGDSTRIFSPLKYPIEDFLKNNDNNYYNEFANGNHSKHKNSNLAEKIFNHFTNKDIDWSNLIILVFVCVSIIILTKHSKICEKLE